RELADRRRNGRADAVPVEEEERDQQHYPADRGNHLSASEPAQVHHDLLSAEARRLILHPLPDRSITNPRSSRISRLSEIDHEPSELPDFAPKRNPAFS